MTDQMLYLTSASLGFLSVAVMSLVALNGWRDWIGLKRFEMEHGGTGHLHSDVEGSSQNTASRIEIADMRERLRKLEAIAAGVDL